MQRLLRGVAADGRLETQRVRQGSARGLACLATVLCFLAAAQSQSNPGTYEVLHTFTSSPDGGNPTAGVVRDTMGNLYGTTSAGGNASAACANSYCGVVFKIDSAGNETVLYSFTGQPDGFNPQAGLIQDAAGNLYGTTCGGGATGNGTVFKVDSSGNETVLYSFAGQPDGSCPDASLVLDAAGDLYGTTKSGGTAGDGTIFKLDTSDKETVLYSFTGQADGKFPQDLLRDSTGNLFGTAHSGGVLNCKGLHGATIGCGTIFELDAAGTFTLLYSFQGLGSKPDGGLPLGGLVADAAGNLYGTTESGGDSGSWGTVFKFDTTGAEKVLHSFSGPNGDGSSPRAGLAIDASGNLYGTTSFNVFELDTSENLTVLYDFTGGADGNSSDAPLLRDPAGNLFGTTSGGGSSSFGDGFGVVFELPAASSPVFNLAITFTGSGTGTVTSNPSGISCPTDCISAFPVGTTVTLTATPTGGSTFGAWSGNCTSTSADVCTVNSTQVLDAIFSPPPPDFTISGSAFTPATVNPGSSSSSTITTTAVGGFSGSITLSCTVQSSVLLAPTCSVSPTSVNAGTSSKVSVSTTGPTAGMAAPFSSGLLYASWLPALGLLVGGSTLARDRRRRIRYRLAYVLLATAVFYVGCGGSGKTGSSGTPAGSYTVVVTGVSGPLQHSVNPNLTLTVQ